MLSWITARVESLGYRTEDIPFISDAGLVVLLLSDPCDDYVAGVMPIQDTEIARLGFEAGAELIGLEPADLLLRDLNQPEWAEVTLAIVQSYGAYLKPYDTGNLTRGQFFALYQKGRIDAAMVLDDWYMEQVFGAEKGIRIARRVNAYLLTHRNQLWQSQLQPLLDAGDAVVAVGSFHLPGETGLISMLRDAGYQVDRVVLPGEVNGVTDW